VRAVDVLDISDLRFPGGTAHSLAEEIHAQYEAGYVTGVLHLNGPLVAKARAINPKVRPLLEAGEAELLVGQEPITARVVVVRHPAVLQHAGAELPRIRTETVVIVANAAPHDIDGHEHYSVPAVDNVARERFGIDPLWAPIGPEVRATIDETVPPQRLVDDDWVNIIDINAWHSPRSGPAADVPVIGRHSRESPQKWPRSLDVLREVYPTDDSAIVRVLGGAKPAERLLGQIPASWQVLPFGTMDSGEFLSSLDFFVYYHDPYWVEAFGRTILEALATGRPAILPPHFSSLFGEAAVYAEPPEVRETMHRLYSDREAYDAQVRRGLAYTRSWFGHGVHVARIDRLIGTPGRRTGNHEAHTSVAPVQTEPEQPAQPPVAQSPVAQSPVAQSGPQPDRVLLITSNGTGMGHLTRMLALARRTSDAVEPHFLSLSQAVPVVEGFGYSYEYLASTGASGLSARRWHRYFARRVGDTIERLAPSVVVFDGTWPYDGILTVRRRHPEQRWIWCRRGMWYAGKNRDQLAKSSWFDLVMEPGDFASSADAGVTRNTDRTMVGPITLLDTDELDTREQACAALGLDPDRRHGLVTLGAGNINSIHDATRIAVQSMVEVGVQPCVPQPAIASGADLTAEMGSDQVRVVRDYPLSRRFAAFDVAVSAAGYNSFHELLRFGVPTLYVPNRATQLDDQLSRADYAVSHGAAHGTTYLDPITTRRMLGELVQDQEGFAGRARALDPGNGAAEAAALVEKLAATPSREPR